AFEGPVNSIYTTLAVRLCRSGVFERHELWRDGLAVRDKAGAVSGIRLRRDTEGKGEVEVFHSPVATDLSRVQLVDFVSSHVLKRSVAESMRVRRGLVCRACRETIPEQQVELRRQRDHTTLQCSICDTVNEISVQAGSKEQASLAVVQMDRNADVRRND